MNLLKTKIFSRKPTAGKIRSFFGFLKNNQVKSEDLDQKLIYDLSPKKIPTGNQLKHLNKYLNPRESLIIKICLFLILINFIYLGITFINKHLLFLPAVGGSYIEGVVGYPKTINPLYAVNRDVDSDLSRLIYSSLLKYNTQGQLINDLAASLSGAENNKEYLVKIRDNVKWQNGENLTADDVIFTINLIKNPDFRSPLRASFAIVEVEKIDNQTIKFNLTEPYAPFPELLTFGVMPKNLWENISPSAISLAELNLKPIGSGPYKFKSLIKNSNGDLKEYNLVANPDYYGQKPYLKNIIFKFFVDYQEMIKAFNDNQLDGLSYLPINFRSELLAPNSVNFYELVRPQIISLFFNSNKNKVLGEKDIRVALTQSLDKDKIITDIFSGVYKRADGPILESNPAYNSQLKKYNFNPGEAINVLQNKLATTTITVIDSNNNLALAQKIKEYWDLVGVKTDLRIISSEQAGDTIKNKDFEILLYGESVGGDPDVYVFWHSSQIGSKGLNLAGYNNPEVDKLLSEARATNNFSDRRQKYQKFQEILTNDAPVIFLYSPTYTYVQNKKIKGFVGTTIIEPADRFSEVSTWYVKTIKKLAW